MPDAPAGNLTARNIAFFEPLWAAARLTPPQRTETWPVISRLATELPRRLEIGPGLRPRLPIRGTTFADLSETALSQLQARGGRAVRAGADALPFADGSFDLIAAFDVIEHVADDRAVFAEIGRVLAAGGAAVFAVPLHVSRWGAFDEMVGHARRYEPAELTARLNEAGLRIERSASFGLCTPTLGRWAEWWYRRRPRVVRLCYNLFFDAVSRRLRRTPVWRPGLIEAAGPDEVAVIARKVGGRGHS